MPDRTDIDSITWGVNVDEAAKEHISQNLAEEDLEEDKLISFSRYIENPRLYIKKYGLLSFFWRVMRPYSWKETFLYCPEHHRVFKKTTMNQIRMKLRH